MKLMENKKGIIMGVANERSIAWGIANELSKHGADLIFTYQNESLKKRIVPLAESVNSKELYQCDVAEEPSKLNSIENFGNDLTVLIVTHRLSTLKFCDFIFHIENSNIKYVDDYKKLNK